MEDFEWAINLNRLGLQLLGLWHQAENAREKLKNNLHVFVVFLMLFFGFLFPYVHSLVRIHNDIVLVVEHVRYIMPLITCVTRIMIFWWKKEVLLEIMNMVAEDWSKSKNQQERNTMIMWAQRARVVVTCGYSVTGIACACMFILPIFGISTDTTNNYDSDKILPLQAYHIYGVIERPQYELIYVIQIIVIFFAGTAYTGIDNCLALLVFHVCGQLDILRTRFVCVDKLVRIHDFKNCIIFHIRILRIIALIEEIFHMILLVLFLNFGVLFSLYGFRILIILEEKDNIGFTHLLHFINVLIVLIVYLALYCIVGEILTTQCDRLYYALCNLEWYLLKPRRAKDLMIFMVKCEEPCYITAGKMLPMTMVTFSSIIKTSAGYISVLCATTI